MPRLGTVNDLQPPKVLARPGGTTVGMKGADGKAENHSCHGVLLAVLASGFFILPLLIVRRSHKL